MVRPSYIRSGAVLLLCAALGGCAKGESDHGGGGGPDAGRLPDAGPRPDAGPDFDSGPTGGTPVTLTQSTSTTITADNSVACTDTDTGFNTEASYFRLFDLAAEGITTPLEVSHQLEPWRPLHDRVRIDVQPSPGLDTRPPLQHVT